MPPIRTPLKKLKDNDANERNSQRRGPKPKSLEERIPNLQVSEISFKSEECEMGKKKRILIAFR